MYVTSATCKWFRQALRYRISVVNWFPSRPEEAEQCFEMLGAQFHT